MANLIFWGCVAMVAYIYFGYPLMVAALTSLQNKRSRPYDQRLPSVSMIIAAHNEEKDLQQKLENSLNLEYPAELLEIVVASDGSTDRTAEIARGFRARGVKVMASRKQVGKSAIQNAAQEVTGGQILVFSDANAFFRPDALRLMVGHFSDPKVGLVVGRVSYLNQDETTVAQGEGMYWQYELFLREMESKAGMLALASGPIMALRRELFAPLDPAMGEDLVLPLHAVARGYRVVYEHRAVSEEVLYQVQPAQMFRTKVRIISKDLRGLLAHRKVLNPLHHPLYAWGLISHKLLRWLVPFFLVAMALSNLLLLGSVFYQVMLALQFTFYLMAGVGSVWQKRGRLPRILGIPFSFCLVNLAALAGVVKYLAGRRSGVWEPVRTRS